MEKRNRVIRVATDEELKDLVYYNRLWLAVRNINIPRRQWLDVLACTFRDYQGDILDGEQLYDLPDIDDVFNDDIDMRWYGYFVAADNSGFLPRAYSNKLERLRLFDLYFKINYREIAEHFLK